MVTREISNNARWCRGRMRKIRQLKSKGVISGEVAQQLRAAVESVAQQWSKYRIEEYPGKHSRAALTVIGSTGFKSVKLPAIHGLGEYTRDVYIHSRERTGRFNEAKSFRGNQSF